MLTSLRLRNFKCFEDITIPLGNLTLLTGANGMGKSSVIQALLLLRQSRLGGFLDEGGLLLNGPLTSLGAADDVLFEDVDKGAKLGFEIRRNSGDYVEFTFDYERGRGIQPLFSSSGSVKNFLDESLFGDDFQYLQAERVGPRSSFQISCHQERKYCEIGKAGEFCAYFLSQRERENIPVAGIRHPSAVTGELREQTEAWLSEISPGTRIHVAEHANMDLVNLEFSFVRKGLPTRNYRAVNVGFGLTYSLPIFIATLASDRGSMILIENPEAHLHPKGQVLIGQFLSKAAENGIQVVVETHSDHVLNGVRLSVKNGELSPEKASIHFFEREENGPRAKMSSPKIDKDGRLNYWPSDFFDQTEKILSLLL